LRTFQLDILYLAIAATNNSAIWTADVRLSQSAEIFCIKTNLFAD